MAPIAPQTVFTKTAKGILEIRNKTVKLSRELGLIFLSVDGKTTVGDLLPRSGMTAPQLHHALNTLVADGYIKVVSHPSQAGAGAGGEIDLDFTSPQAMAKLNMEAASRALAEADATKRAQLEARAALEARLRQEAESRARLLAEARAQAEAEAKATAEAAATAAIVERSKAETEASGAADPAQRAQAEARARAASELVVRAQAEARVRGEAEDRARAQAEEKRKFEEAARTEAETRSRGEEQAQARAVAEARAREALEAQLHAMAGVRAHADNPEASEAEAARGKLRALEAEAERAREAARAVAQSEGRGLEEPQPEMDIADRVRQLTARGHAQRVAREENERQSRAGITVDANGTETQQAQKDAFPFLQLSDDAPAARAFGGTEPTPVAVSPGQSSPADEFAKTADLTSIDLPVVRLEDTQPIPEVKVEQHAPSALERAMEEAAARAHTKAAAEKAETPPPPAPASASAPAAAAKAEPANQPALTIDDDDEPRKERLNVDRTAHDIMAESAETRRKAEAAELSRTAADARRHRIEEEARRAAVALRQQRRRKALVGLGVVLVAAPALAVAWLQFTPLNGYIPAAQRALSERLNQPVNITTLRYVMLPTPRLILEGVWIGKGQGVRAERVEAHTLPFALWGGAKSFDTVHVQGVEIDAAILGTIPAWTGGRTAGAVHVDRLRLTDMKFNVPGIDVGAFNGEVAFAPNGTVKQAQFSNPKVTLQLNPRAEGVRFTVEAREWRIPFGPPVEFSYVTFNGLVDHAQIAASEFTGRLASGTIQGAFTARWAGPVRVEGEFKLENARLQELTQVLTPGFAARGILKANGRYVMQADAVNTIFNNAQLVSTFSVARGELSNIDLVRAIQSATTSAIRGGRTVFDELSGTLQIARDQVTYRQLQMTSGPLNASGQIDIGPASQLTGRLTAEIAAGRGGVQTRASLLIGGTVKDPQLRR